MSEVEQRILQMVQDSTITAEEAHKLLEALEPQADTPGIIAQTSGDLPAGQEVIVTTTGEVVLPAQPPDMERFRRFWRIPFLLALGCLLLSGLGLGAVYRAAGGAATFGFLCIGSVFMLTLLAAALALWSRWAYWLHVRIDEKSGERIAISLPLPLRGIGLVLKVARPLLGREKARRLQTAAEVLKAMRGMPGREPLTISVDDEDGAQVRVYIG